MLNIARTLFDWCCIALQHRVGDANGCFQKCCSNSAVYTGRLFWVLQILNFDNDESLPKSELVEENLDVLQPFEPPVRQRAQPVPTPRRTESVSSITSLESSAGEVDKVPSFASHFSRLLFSLLFSDETLTY